MNTPDPNTGFTTPSARNLLLSLGFAIVVSIIILLVIVLPAEYGIDPTGLGGVMGLTALSDPPEPVVDTATTPTAPTAGSAENPVPDAALAAEEETVPGEYTKLDTPPGTALKHDSDYLTDTVQIPLAAEEELEYKFKLGAGEPLLYSWSIDRGDIYFDFHGEPDTGELVFMSYEEGEGNSGQGYLVAPYNGNHGWYFLNYNDFPVTVTLKVSGYYSWKGNVKDLEHE